MLSCAEGKVMRSHGKQQANKQTGKPQSLNREDRHWMGHNLTQDQRNNPISEGVCRQA